MQRRFERDEMYRVIFDTNNLDKKINFENDNNLDYIYIINGKSGITDKSCSRAQAKRSIVIINAALIDDNVKFRIKKNSEYFVIWKISQNEIFKNAITYLESKGITIKCTYRNFYDIKLLKKFIAKIFCEYVIPAIYYPNTNDSIEDNDDISVPFVKMVDDINKLLSNTSISDIIYDLAETNELLRVKDNFITNPKEHKIATINNTSYFVIPFNIDYRTTLKISKDRFIEEFGVIFEPTCDIESDPFQMFLPKYFIYII